MERLKEGDREMERRGEPEIHIENIMLPTSPIKMFFSISIGIWRLKKSGINIIS